MNEYLFNGILNGFTGRPWSGLRNRAGERKWPDRKIFRKISVLPRKSRFGGASVVLMGKRKMQVFDFQALAFCWVPGAEAPLLLCFEVPVGLIA